MPADQIAAFPSFAVADAGTPVSSNVRPTATADAVGVWRGLPSAAADSPASGA